MPPSSRSFQVSGLLTNRHIQSILASSSLRKRLHANQHHHLRSNQTDIILNAGNNTFLHCLYSPNNTSLNSNKKLVVLIHGWEGSADSTYLVSSASALYNQGFSVIRLHLRDHGPSAYLNKELFHAARLDEVILALKDIQSRFPYERYYLGGFSLGGNFALRIAQQAKFHQLNFEHVVAISPVFSPADTMKALENGTPIYRQYFIKKWKKSLRNKVTNFPDIYDLESILVCKTLTELTDHLVALYTPFKQVEEYYESYKLQPSYFLTLETPCTIFLAEDDPVIPIESAATFSSNTHVSFIKSKHGGHCGFIKNWRLESWIDDTIVNLFNAS